MASQPARTLGILKLFEEGAQLMPMSSRQYLIEGKETNVVKFGVVLIVLAKWYGSNLACFISVFGSFWVEVFVVRVPFAVCYMSV